MWKRPAVLLIAIAVFATPGVVRAQQRELSPLFERCATRDTATAWLRSLDAWSSERPGSWTNDSLRTVLIALAGADRAARPAPRFADSLRVPDVAIRIARRDSATLDAMREIIRRFGWPTRSMVGVAGASAAIEIARNNPALQAEALRLMWALPPHEIQQSEVAELEDRYHVARNEPQRFATQLRPDTGGMAEFHPVDSLFRVGERRTAVGLSPLSVYLCVIRAATGRDTKFPPPVHAATAVTPPFRPYWYPRLRAYAGLPQILSISVSAMYVMWRSHDRARWSGVFAVAEPGVRAGKVGAGYGSAGLDGLGVSGMLSLLRVWDDGPWTTPAPLYAGYEFHVSARRLDVGGGVYQSLPGGKLRLGWSVGTGLWANNPAR